MPQPEPAPEVEVPLPTGQLQPQEEVPQVLDMEVQKEGVLEQNPIQDLNEMEQPIIEQPVAQAVIHEAAINEDIAQLNIDADNPIQQQVPERQPPQMVSLSFHAIRLNCDLTSFSYSQSDGCPNRNVT